MSLHKIPILNLRSNIISNKPLARVYTTAEKVFLSDFQFNSLLIYFSIFQVSFVSIVIVVCFVPVE